MAKVSKRRKSIAEKVEAGKFYPIDEAVNLLKNCSTVKFTESVEVSINLGVDPRKSDQMVRGAVVLPHGTGKNTRVAVFAQNELAEAAKEAGADKVGFDELAASVKAGELDFDVVIASPDSMALVGQLGQILGPRGLMPNPKVGTVTKDVATAVKNAKTGQARYRTDKNGIIHCLIGKIDFSNDALKENLLTLLTAIRKAKPTSSKGTYIKKITLSTTMGPGLTIEKATVED